MRKEHYNPDIYICENLNSRILKICDPLSLMVYLELENLKKLNHAGKINFKYANFDNYTSIIPDKKVYNQCILKLLKENLIIKKGEYYTTPFHKKEKGIIKFDMSLFVTLGHQIKKLPSNARLQTLKDKIYMEFFNLYYNYSRSNRQKRLGLSPYQQRNIEKRNKVISKQHFEIINFRTATDESLKKYGESPMFPLYYHKKTKTTSISNKKKFNCYGKQSVNKYLIENNNSILRVRRNNETSIRDAESISIDSVKEVVDDNEDFIKYKNDDNFKFFKHQNGVDKYMKKMSSYELLYNLTEKGYFKRVNAINNHPLTSL